MGKVLTNCYLFAVAALTISLIGCRNEEVPVKDSQPLGANLVGKWQWIKSVKPTGEVTPQTLGYNKSLSYGNDGGVKGNYLYLTETGNNIPLVLYQNNTFGQVDSLNHSLTAKFDSQYIQFFLVKGNDNTYQEMITTDLVSNYTQGFGSVRHYYKRAGVPDKPVK